MCLCKLTGVGRRGIPLHSSHVVRCAGEGSCTLFREKLLPTALSLATDPVPNVRLAVCRLLSQAACCDAGSRPGSGTNVQAATGCAAAAAASFSSMSVEQDGADGCGAVQKQHAVSAPSSHPAGMPVYDAAFRRLTRDTDGDVRAPAAACSSQCLMSC